MSTSDSLDIDNTYIDTPTVTAIPKIKEARGCGLIFFNFFFFTVMRNRKLYLAKLLPAVWTLKKG